MLPVSLATMMALKHGPSLRDKFAISVPLHQGSNRLPRTPCRGGLHLHRATLDKENQEIPKTQQRPALAPLSGTTASFVKQREHISLWRGCSTRIGKEMALRGQAASLATEPRTSQTCCSLVTSPKTTHLRLLGLWIHHLWPALACELRHAVFRRASCKV